MKTKLMCGIAMAAFALPAVTQTNQMKVSDLSELCSANDEASSAGCRFYILGVMEGTSIGAGMAKDKDHFCIPEGVSDHDLTRIVKQRMKDDLKAFPKDSDMPAVSFVAAVLMQSYPCSK